MTPSKPYSSHTALLRSYKKQRDGEMEQIRLDHEWKCREVTEKFEIQRREAIRQVNEVERLTLSDLQHQYHAERDAALLRHSEKLGFARQKYAIPDHISETAEDGGTSPSTTLATYSSRPNMEDTGQISSAIIVLINDTPELERGNDNPSHPHNEATHNPGNRLETIPLTCKQGLHSVEYDSDVWDLSMHNYSSDSGDSDDDFEPSSYDQSMPFSAQGLPTIDETKRGMSHDKGSIGKTGVFRKIYSHGQARVSYPTVIHAHHQAV